MIILGITCFSGLFAFKTSPIPIKIFSLYILISFLVEIGGIYTMRISHHYTINNFLYNIYTLIEVILVLFYFKYILNASFYKKHFYLFIILLFFGNLYLITSSIIPQNQMFLLSLSFFIFLALAYLKQLLLSKDEISRNPHFWIVMGILFFNAGFFFLSGFLNFISKKDEILASKLFSINHILNMIYYSLVTYGFICQRNLAK